MKRFKAVVVHCLANVVEVVANSKEEAEAKLSTLKAPPISVCFLDIIVLLCSDIK